jgi:uncharacterized spore protein YtfJ
LEDPEENCIMSDSSELESIEPASLESVSYHDSSLDTIEELMESLHAAASVESVYGAPIKQRDTLIIPAAEIVTVGGFGLGQGFGGPESEGESVGGAGGGGGGGGRSFARPVAVIVVSPEGVRVEPIFDLTKIALAGITFAAFAVGMLARLGQAESKIKKMSKAIE